MLMSLHLHVNGARSKLMIPAEVGKQGWISFLSLVSEYPGSRSSSSPKSYKDAVQPDITPPSKPPLPPIIPPPTPKPPSSPPSSSSVNLSFLIVERKSFQDSWPQICLALQVSSPRCVINPFQDDKALVYLFDDVRSRDLLASDDWISVENFRLRFYDFRNPAAYQSSKVGFLGGWIEITDLPFFLWNDQVFQFIGDLCGGFMEVALQTQAWINPSSARIRVQRTASGFVPRRICLPASIAGSETTIQISCSTAAYRPPAAIIAPASSPPNLAPCQPPVFNAPCKLSPPRADKPTLASTSALKEKNPTALNATEFSPQILAACPPASSTSPALNAAEFSPQILAACPPPSSTSPLSLGGPSKSTPPTVSHPTFSKITLPSTLQPITANFTSQKPLGPISDSEFFLSSPGSSRNEDHSDFSPLPLDHNIGGDSSFGKTQPLAFLPPMPPDLSPPLPHSPAPSALVAIPPPIPF